MLYGIDPDFNRPIPPTLPPALDPTHPPSPTSSPADDAIPRTPQPDFEFPITREQEEAELERALEASRVTATAESLAPNQADYINDAFPTELDPSTGALVVYDPTPASNPLTPLEALPDSSPVSPVRLTAGSFWGMQRPPARRAQGEYPLVVTGLCPREKARIGCILTVLHSIPAARNFLLGCGDLPPGASYGGDSKWWASCQPDDRVDTDPWQVELHRLMAYLDAGEHAHWYADRFAISCIKAEGPSGPATRHQIVRCDDIVLDRLNSTDFESVLAPRVKVRTVEAEYGCPAPMIACVLTTEELAEAANLYGAWDRTTQLVPSRVGDSEKFYVSTIDVLSKVVLIRFEGGDLPPVFDIPETFYADRYMSDRVAELRDIHEHTSMARKALESIDEKIARLTACPAAGPARPEGESHDYTKGIQSAIEHYEGRIQFIRNFAFWREHEKRCADGPTDLYEAEHSGEPDLLPNEALLVREYQNKLEAMKKRAAVMERLMNGASSRKLDPWSS